MVRQRRKLHANGLNFVVTICGEEKATPIVLLHGFPNAASIWDKQAGHDRVDRKVRRLLESELQGELKTC